MKIPKQQKTDVGMIVVIPCYDDEMIFMTLQSLEETDESCSGVEVIVVVNSAENSATQIVEKNRKVYGQLKMQDETDYYKRFRLHPIIIENVPVRKAGVGNARRTGMEEAVRQFSEAHNPNGIIASLDADCKVEREYFSQLEKAFSDNPKKICFTLQFQHDFDERLYSPAEIAACKSYETYLRYFRLALKAAGFPYTFHTIGSCFAFKAEIYDKVGGMPTKQGGEDFYFLHKAAQVTEVGIIKKKLVFPSPRISERVPFGTGISVKNIIENRGQEEVYNWNLFLMLKDFFDWLKKISEAGEFTLEEVPAEIKDFWGEEKLESLVCECIQNANKGKNLLKRLFSRFDAFFVVKFLNSFKDDERYCPMDVAEAAILLLKHYKIDGNENNLYDLIQALDVEMS